MGALQRERIDGDAHSPASSSLVTPLCELNAYALLGISGFVLFLHLFTC